MRLSFFLLPVVLAASAAEAASYVQSYKTWTLESLKCWTDRRDNVRVLRDQNFDVPAASMTVPKCLDACAAKNYSMAGVEYGQECWCGNTAMGTNYGEDYYPPYTTGRCSTPCAGDSSQICGGSSVINIYVRDNYKFTTGMYSAVVQSYGPWAVTVCWDDYYNGASPRILPHIPHKTKLDYTRLTVAQCLDACAADGWTDAGVEYGNQCYCNNSTYPVGQSTSLSECNMGCTGDASQICGAGQRMLVYHKGSWP